MIPVWVFSQVISVKGTVKDPLGESVIGASVMEKGTTNGTITDLNGNFTLQVPRGAVLVISFIGYKTQEVSVSGATPLSITISEDTKILDEVVVIGYGTQRREAVTGSVSSIREDAIKEIPSTNITQALQGRIAGVDMTQTSTKPGAAMQIRIRGTRSLTASNDPQIVLDGIPFAGSINDIDPNSIKSIDILKDASATAIYGSRGANGVIMITTNRGQKNTKAKITYNSYFGMKNAIKYPVMDGPRFAQLRADVAQTAKDLNKTNSNTNSADESNDINTDWQEMLYRTGIVTNHDVGLTKGTEDGNYTFGLGYYKDQAVVPTQEYSRISLRAAFDQNVGKYIRVGLTSNNSYGHSQGNQIDINPALAASPLADPYDENGKLKRAVYSSQDVVKVWTKESVEDVKDLWLSESKTLGSYNNIYGEVEAPWVKGLKYRMNLGLNIRYATGGGFTGRGVTSETNPNNPSSASVNNSLTTNWTVENLVTFDRTFADKHHLNVVGMYSAEETKYNRSDISVRDFPADHFQYFNLGYGEGEITINKDNQHYQVSGLTSWMGRVMYDYDDRYMLSLTMRSDGSSRLAPGHKWHTYPAVSAGWNIHREAFMEKADWLNALKFRVGYGETSNQAIDPYKTLGLLNTRFYNFGDNGDQSYATGYYISELPNENLGWEYTETWNFGLYFSLFNRRLSGTIEYYRQHTKDILLEVTLPSTTGVGSYIANIGETENKGFELSLNGVILDNYHGFTWEAGLNLYANRNKLIALTSGQTQNVEDSWFVGYPIDVLYDHKKIGLWQEGDPYLDILEPGGNVGMIKVGYRGEYNANGEPVREIGSDDRYIMDINPDFQGGFNTRLAYKGFDLGVVGTFKSGGTLISAIYGGTRYLNNLNGRVNNVDVDYWTPQNTNAKYPRPFGAEVAGGRPKYVNTLGYFDASYVKIRTITLGYNFNQQWLKKNLGVERLRLYATVQNPFVLFSPYHKESGMDPEPNSYGDENQSVTDEINERLPIVASNTPSTRNYLVGINLTF
jgi:TonB-linked SusC/RagA family outer membrane protein